MAEQTTPFKIPTAISLPILLQTLFNPNELLARPCTINAED